MSAAVASRSVAGMTPKEAAAVIVASEEEKPRDGVAPWRRSAWRFSAFVRAFRFAVARRHPTRFAAGYAEGRAKAWAEAQAVAFALGEDVGGRVGARTLTVEARAPGGEDSARTEVA